MPWSSKIARPEGVWRRVGRGLFMSMSMLVLDLNVVDAGRGWRGIEGMVSPFFFFLFFPFLIRFLLLFCFDRREERG